jgi:hypothetical protein
MYTGTDRFGIRYIPVSRGDDNVICVAVSD